MKLGFRRRPRVDLAPGLAIVPKQTRSGATIIWVGLCGDPDGALAPNEVQVDITLQTWVQHDDGGVWRQVRIEPATLKRYEYVGGDDLEFFHGHHLVDGLEPHTTYKATARPAAGASVSGGRVGLHGSCRFKTLPDSVGSDPFRIVVASCFDIGTDTDRQLPALCTQLFTDEFPDMTMLLGDQVYLDAPWWQFRTRTKHDPRQYYLAKYWSAWGHGVDGHDGLRPLLSVGGNWFLPDDHEFWNNFPHATPLALHSLRNWRKILAARLDRFRQWRENDREIPRSLVEVPSPSEWGTWSRGAYELFSSFQTPSKPDTGSTFPISAGAADPDQAASPAVSEVIQQVDIGGVRIILVDTRTQRSRSARHKESGFLTVAHLDDLITRVTFVDDRGPDLVIVALAQPAFIPPTNYEGFANRIRAFIDFDRGMENYEHMYRDFWNRLVDARGGRPLVFVGGDVHYNEVAIAPALVMAQIISSPMSLVEGLSDLKRLRRTTARKSDDRAELDTAQLHGGRPGEINRLTPLKEDPTEGLTTLDLTHDNHTYRLAVEHHPRQLSKPTTRTALIIDPNHPDPRQRICRQPPE